MPSIASFKHQISLTKKYSNLMSRNVFFPLAPLFLPSSSHVVLYYVCCTTSNTFFYAAPHSPLPSSPPPPSSTLIFKVFSSLHYFLLPSWLQSELKSCLKTVSAKGEGEGKKERRLGKGGGDVPMLPPFPFLKAPFLLLIFFCLLPPKMNWALEERKRKGGLHASAEKYVIPRSLSLSF